MDSFEPITFLKEQKNQTCNDNELDEDLLKHGYYEYCYNLDGIEDLIESQYRVSLK